MLDIYIFRHGEAEPRGKRGDAARRLTGGGKAEVRRVAQGLARLGAEIDVILTSPLVRAEETAAIAGDVLKPPGGVRRCDALAPGGTNAALFKELSGLRKSCVMLVGHQPDLGELASVLVWGSPGVGIALKKAGVVRVLTERLPPAATGELRWVLTPKHLSLIARAPE
jgi:phosphohistidine phosphatase